MLDIAGIARHLMASEPYAWAEIERTIAPRDAAALAASFPIDHFKDVAGYDGEKSYAYRARSLIPMGAEVASHPGGLSPEWRRLVEDLLSPAYRQAMMRLTGLDLSAALLEANVTEYGADAWLGPHVDLREKLVTHVLYFNQEWNRDDGGSLCILRSSDPMDVAHEIVPMAGKSAVLVRCARSWHMVASSRGARRRAVNVIFHQPGSISTMWPPEQTRRESAGQPAHTANWGARLAAMKRKLAKLL